MATAQDIRKERFTRMPADQVPGHVTVDVKFERMTEGGNARYHGALDAAETVKVTAYFDPNRLPKSQFTLGIESARSVTDSKDGSYASWYLVSDDGSIGVTLPKAAEAQFEKVTVRLPKAA